MSNQYSSNFIFSLANKYHIFIDSLNSAEFSDETYLGFCKEYIEHSKTRDVNLKLHLNDKPNLFRTFLPWRAYIFNTVFQLQWYYDELVIYDPIVFEINHFKTDNIEEDKNRLRQLLFFLNSLKESIDEGFLLFGSYDTFVTANKTLEENKFETLLSVAEVRNECDKLVQVYKMVSTEGLENSYFNVRSYYRNKQVMFTVVKDFEKIRTEEGYGVWFDLVGSNYIPLSIEDTKKEGFYDRAYDGFKEEYGFEIREILNYIDVGSNIKTHVLFDRKLDEYVLANIALNENLATSKASDYLKLILPFVNGVPPEKLFDIRTTMPNAFLDFRNLMFEIIYDYEKSGIESGILELKIQQKINPLLRKLDAEMKNSLTKAKIIGAGLPLVSGIGALGLWHFGVDITKFTTLLLGGVNVAAEFTAVTNYLTEQRTGKSNSLYYLWEAQRSK